MKKYMTSKNLLALAILAFVGFRMWLAKRAQVEDKAIGHPLMPYNTFTPGLNVERVAS